MKSSNFLIRFIRNHIKSVLNENTSDKFELGTPAVYHSINFNGQQEEVSGEVVMNREEYKSKDGMIYSPQTIKGMSLYADSNYSGSGYRFIVPDWNNVERFSEANRRTQNSEPFIIRK